MPENIPFNPSEHFKKQYEDTVRHLVQQKGSKLLSRIQTMGKGGEELFFDLFGPRDPNEVLDRYGDSPNNEQTHKRRRLTHTDWEDGKLFEKVDAVRSLNDPKNPVIQSMSMGFGRTIDKTIYDFLRGTAYSGKAGATTNALPSSQKVAVDFVNSGAAANSGLTVGKLIRTVEIFEQADLDVTPETVTFIGTAKQKNDLLNTTQVTSQDYAAVKALVTGQVDEFLNMKFVWLNGKVKGTKIVTTIATNVRACVAFHRDHAVLDMPEPMRNELGQDPAKKFNWRLYMAMTIGGVRLQEEGVVEVACHELVT